MYVDISNGYSQLNGMYQYNGNLTIEIIPHVSAHAQLIFMRERANAMITCHACSIISFLMNG